MLRPVLLTRSADEPGGTSPRSGPGSMSSASTTGTALPPTTAGAGDSSNSSSATSRLARDSARKPPAMSSKICSNGRDPTSTLTAVRALNPARSGASRIAASFTASETFSSTAIFSSSRAIRSAASSIRWRALALTAGALPPWWVQRAAGERGHHRQGSEPDRCLVAGRVVGGETVHARRRVRAPDAGGRRPTIQLSRLTEPAGPPPCAADGSTRRRARRTNAARCLPYP